MAGNRKKAEEFLLEFIGKIEQGNRNVELYKKTLKEMSDGEFEKLMTSIEEGNFTFPLIMPNFENSKSSTEHAIKIGKQLGHNFFKRLILTDPATGEQYTTPLPYMVCDLPVRRQKQTIDDKLSIAEDNNHLDALTDQPTGISKSSAITFPELGVLYSLGLNDSIKELIKVRGGDTKANNQLNRDIIETGEGDLERASSLNTKVKSTETLSILLKGMHLQNNL